MKRRRMLREQPLGRLFPNMITIAGLCCGLSAVRFALAGRWEIAVAFILAAALLDGMDGRIARLLGATSVFGAQLDSLSDFLCFGVAPALVLYMWQLHEIRGIGWAVVLLFAVCCALRLARFNTGLLVEQKEAWEKQFFVGVPSPAGGILCLLPLIVSLQFSQEYAPPAALTACHAMLVAVLMASRIPTFSGKMVRIKHEMILPFMIGSAFVLILLLVEPWLLITLASFVYLASIVVSVRMYRRLKLASLKKEQDREAQERH